MVCALDALPDPDPEIFAPVQAKTNRSATERFMGVYGCQYGGLPGGSMFKPQYHPISYQALEAPKSRSMAGF